MAEFNKSRALLLEGNLEENFENFKQEIEIYFQATETIKKSTEIQVARFLNLMGPDVLKIYNTLKIEEKTVDCIMKSIPKKNEVMELYYKFFTRKQQDNEPFDKYYLDLKQLVKTCGLGETEQKILRTQVILGKFIFFGLRGSSSKSASKSSL